VLKELIKLANELDAKGLAAEADALDEIILQAQQKGFMERSMDAVERGYKSLKDAVTPEEDPMDIARDQEKEKKLNELKKELKASHDWFQANIFVSVDDKFPLITPELTISPRVYSGVTGGYIPVLPPSEKAPAMIIPSGTEFSGLDEDKPIKGGYDEISLRDAWDVLQRSMKRFGVQ
tara:strand:- start:39 stop:572 length:534 start_codon:yes stop_codon:yes gene_type:complete